jgi:predicted RecB family nuclease
LPFLSQNRSCNKPCRSAEVIVKKDDLSKVKHVGAARMKRLHEAGITTVDQLCAAPLEELARIENIGAHYARLIKDAAAEFCQPVADQTPVETEAVEPQKKDQRDQDFLKQVKLLRRRLKQTTEKLKPLGKNKYLPLYVDLKKSSKQLTKQLKEISRLEEELARKGKKKIVKKADALNLSLKSVGKKPKKKIYNNITRQLRQFSAMLEKAR